MTNKQWICIIFIVLPLLAFSQQRKLMIQDSARYSVSMIYEAVVDMIYLYEDYLEVSLLGYSEFGQAIPVLKISDTSTKPKKARLPLYGMKALIKE